MPANWQAQCSAISQRFCSTTSRWSPRARPASASPALHRRRCAAPIEVAPGAGRRRRSPPGGAALDACRKVRPRSWALRGPCGRVTRYVHHRGDDGRVAGAKRHRCPDSISRTWFSSGTPRRCGAGRRRTPSGCPPQKPHPQGMVWRLGLGGLRSPSRASFTASLAARPSTVRARRGPDLQLPASDPRLRDAVDLHRAGSAHAVLAADVRARGAEIVTQEIRQQPARRCTGAALAPVQGEAPDVRYAHPAQSCRSPSGEGPIGSAAAEAAHQLTPQRRWPAARRARRATRRVR